MGGTVGATASPLGGLRIELSLPTAAPAPDERATPAVDAPAERATSAVDAPAFRR
jgi:hypothetical protein